jgi:hypothetical protein
MCRWGSGDPAAVTGEKMTLWWMSATHLRLHAVRRKIARLDSHGATDRDFGLLNFKVGEVNCRWR